MRGRRERGRGGEEEGKRESFSQTSEYVWDVVFRIGSGKTSQD